MEICLWRTLESTLEILYIFIPKLIYKQQQQDLFHDHLVTIINASTLLSSVIRVILSKFKNEETTTETLSVVNRLIELVERMRHQSLDKKSYKVNKK